MRRRAGRKNYDSSWLSDATTCGAHLIDEFVEILRRVCRQNHRTVTLSCFSSRRVHGETVAVLLIPKADDVPARFAIFELWLDQQIERIVSGNFAAVTRRDDRQTEILVRQHVGCGRGRAFLFDLMSPPRAH